MVKCRVTRKWLKDNYDCIEVDYCGLAFLLQYKNPDYYTCGVYGWNFDAYVVRMNNGREICITTGYRNMIDNCKHNNNVYEACRDYNNRAREILEEWSGKAQEQLDTLILQFLNEIFTGGKEEK